MDPHHSVQIRVTDPQLDPTKNFIVYLISGHDSLGTFEIKRRYNDFFYFRQCLKKRWPGLYIPPIPEKKINININSQDEQQVQYRRKFFQYFLRQLSTIHYLFASPMTQQFLRNQSIVFQKYYQTVAEPRTQQLIEQYIRIFPNLNYKETIVENKGYCNNFSGYLKKAEKQIKGLTAEMGSIVEARASFLQNLNIVNTTVLPQYQKNVYSEYVTNTKRDPVLLFVHDHKVQDNIRNLRDTTLQKGNPFGYFYDLLVYEGREIEAFQQAIHSKDEQQSARKKLEQKLLACQTEVTKLMGGKFSIKSIFSKGTKNQQISLLQKEIPEMQKQIEKLGQLCEVLNCIQATFEIPLFKKNKQRQYYEILKVTSQRELQYLSSYGEFMKSVMEGLNRIIEGKQ